MDKLKATPPWFVLVVLFILLMSGYYIRPDNVTEAAINQVLGAILLSLQLQPKATPPAP